MTPEEAMAAALDSDIAVAHVMCVDELCTIKTAPDRPAASILWTLANVHGYSLVPTADLDRLRAVELDVERLARAISRAFIRCDLEGAREIAREYAALGDRTAEEGR